MSGQVHNSNQGWGGGCTGRIPSEVPTWAQGDGELELVSTMTEEKHDQMLLEIHKMMKKQKAKMDRLVTKHSAMDKKNQYLKNWLHMMCNVLDKLQQYSGSNWSANLSWILSLGWPSGNASLSSNEAETEYTEIAFSENQVKSNMKENPPNEISTSSPSQLPTKPSQDHSSKGKQSEEQLQSPPWKHAGIMKAKFLQTLHKSQTISTKFSKMSIQ